MNLHLPIPRPFSKLAALLLLGSAACGIAQPGPALPTAPPAPSAEPVAVTAAGDGGVDNAAPSAAPPVELAEEETASDKDKDEIDDGAESPASEGPGQVYKHPLDGWTKDQIEAAYVKNPESLGSMSIGFTNSGALVNGMQMPAGEAWNLVNPGNCWGTKETVDYLTHCLNRVAELYPGSPKMFIGHISAKNGGHLSPHKSHQAGRDVDISYYYVGGQEKWYATATSANLDRERTWAFIRTLVTETDVQLILMDRSVQRLVRQYAISRGEDHEWVDQLFDGGGGLPPLIRHAKGHATHIHVRFYNPLAQETGRRAYEILLHRHVLKPPTYFVNHKAKAGDTLSALAKKYSVPAKTIQQLNGMKTDVLKVSREYKIPQRGGVKSCPLVVVPARRCPPEMAAVPRAEQKPAAQTSPGG